MIQMPSIGSPDPAAWPAAGGAAGSAASRSHDLINRGIGLSSRWSGDTIAVTSRGRRRRRPKGWLRVIALDAIARKAIVSRHAHRPRGPRGPAPAPPPDLPHPSDPGPGRPARL